jgi:prepilin-type N-terminal cleavage/methylation domain-containing protein
MKQTGYEKRRQRDRSGEKGVTLTEIIISLAILGVIATAFLSTFSSGYSNIFISGNKNQAMVAAAAKMERLYSVRMSTVSSDFQGFLGEDTEQCTAASLFTYVSGKSVNFMVEPIILNGINGYRVTMVSFYHNGTRHIKLGSFVKEG